MHHIDLEAGGNPPFLNNNSGPKTCIICDDLGVFDLLRSECIFLLIIFQCLLLIINLNTGKCTQMLLLLEPFIAFHRIISLGTLQRFVKNLFFYGN